MATSFPTSLDSFTNPTASNNLGTVGVVHHEQHANINDAVAALEAKVGVNSSAVTSSLDYRVTALEGGAGVVPVGGIIMWSGTIATIPANWALCDGTANAPGPDLRDKFVVGATSDQGGVAKTNITGALLQSGGVNTHTHDSHTVTQPVVADHSITQPAISNHSITQPAVNDHSITQPVVSAHVRGTDVALSAHALGTNVAVADHTLTTNVGIAAHAITQPAINDHSITQPVVSTHTITQPVVSAHVVTTSNCRTSASAAAAAVTAIADHTLSTQVAIAAHTLTTNVALSSHALGTNVAVSAHTITQPVVSSHTITQPAVNAHTITQPAFNDHTLSTNVALSAHSLGTSVALSAHSLSTSVALSSHSLSTPAAVSAHSTADNIPTFFSLAFIQRVA